MRPKKFINKTNGVTPRRWLRACNPELTAFYDKLIGSDEWTLDMGLLRNLEKYADDTNTLLEFNRIKKNNKLRLVKWVREHCRIEVNADSLFDI